MSSTERAQLIREVKWPPMWPSNHDGAGDKTEALHPRHQEGPGASGVEAFVKNSFPVLRPVPFKILVGGVVAIVGIAGILCSIIIGTGTGSIQVGDCVTTWTNPLNGNDHIDKTSCSASNALEVFEVQNTPNGDCFSISAASVTFQDQVTGQTYCLGTGYSTDQP